MSSRYCPKKVHEWMASAASNSTLPDVPDDFNWYDEFFYDPEPGSNLILRKSPADPSVIVLRAWMKRSGKITFWCNAPARASTMEAVVEKYLTSPIPKAIRPVVISEPGKSILLAEYPVKNPNIVQTSGLLKLPLQVLLEVCFNLCVGDIVNLSQTCCSALNDLANNQGLWYLKLAEVDHPLTFHGGVKQFDDTVNYFAAAVVFVDGGLKSYDTCHHCLNRLNWRAVHHTFVGTAELVPFSTPFHLPVKVPLVISIPDWRSYVLAWRFYGYLELGMTFHQKFTEAQLASLVASGKVKSVNGNMYTLGIKNVGPLGKGGFYKGDQFARFNGLFDKWEWSANPKKGEELKKALDLAPRIKKEG
ncbi:hypothetical protein TWF481_004877 [Arthrobotrys musiformis]|uniref:F-box domain-containing protein n=1 Tax=Arthrobotrys musiformis TaxID=47236 RepID=A0AAV9WRJ5_9PEZI